MAFYRTPVRKRERDKNKQVVVPSSYYYLTRWHLRAVVVNSIERVSFNFLGAGWNKLKM
jgi:hypothetical protein